MRRELSSKGQGTIQNRKFKIVLALPLSLPILCHDLLKFGIGFGFALNKDDRAIPFHNLLQSIDPIPVVGIANGERRNMFVGNI